MRSGISGIACFAKAFALLCGILGMSACSGQQQETEELETSEASEDDAATTDEVVIDADTTEEGPLADLGTDIEAVEPVEPTPAPQAVSGSVETNRVVRFVTADEAVVHEQASDTAASVGKLTRGDKVIVIEENGWGRISDGMFIKLDTLSAKAVDRHRQPAVWTRP